MSQYNPTVNLPCIEPSEFTSSARWIWADAPIGEAWWMFRRCFAITESGIRHAQLKITSDRYHIAYINGKLVHRGQGRTFHFAQAYSVIDITPYLIKGRNVIAVLSLELDGNPDEAVGPVRGMLAEIDLIDHNGPRQSLSSDHQWRVREHRSFAKNVHRSWVMPGIGESFDARLEEIGWTLPDYDDSSWSNACELGPVGTPPWTGMMKSNVSLPSQDAVYPVRFSAIELARTKKGYPFRLGPTSAGIMFHVTQVTAATETKVILWNMPHLSLDGQVVKGNEITISKGTHLLTFCHLAYYSNTQPEIFFETTASLNFSAAVILDGRDNPWAYLCMPTKTLKYPWHETAADVLNTVPEVQTLMTISSVKDINEKYPSTFKPTVLMENSTLYQAMARQYIKVAGGFTDLAIEQGQPRAQGDPTYQKPLINEQNLLHANVDVCSILPQQDRDVHFIVDFERLLIGYVCLELDTPADTVVEVTCFEMINGSGVSWMNTYNSFSYTCREGRQQFLSHLRRGFRYISVTLRNFNRPIRFNRLCCYHSAYPIQKIGNFECSDELLNQIYKMSIDTASLCMQDTYVDCAGHEQSLWVGDARITAMINLLTYGACDLNQHHIRIVGQSLYPQWVKEYWRADERYQSGRYLPIAAFPTTTEGGLPMWTFMWMMQCWEHYYFGANLTDLNENFKYISETIRHCQLLINERGLFDMPGAWNLIEWANNDLSPYGEVTANNVLLVQCLQQAARMAKILGREDLAVEYDQEVTTRLDAINRYCWDDTRQAYVDTVRDNFAYEHYLQYCKKQDLTSLPFEKYASCTRVSEQTNTLALLCGCVPAERMEYVIKIVRRVQKQHFVPGGPFTRSCGTPTEKEAPGGIVAVGSPFFLFFSLEALFKIGDVETALNIIRTSWGQMIEHGTKGCWETFKQDDKYWTRSITHAWSASPAIYLPTEILGIKAVEPGYKKFTIIPRATGLKWARGSVATPSGPIQVMWTKNNDGTLAIKYSAPQDCERM